jgi:hypothetical protein
LTTSLIDINDLFLTLIDDYRLNKLYEQSVSNFNTHLEGWLLFAIEDFSGICTQELVYDESTQEFSVTLTRKHKLILAQIMVKYWLHKEVFNILQMDNFIQDRDYKAHSAAQNLREKQAALAGKEEEISQLLLDYEMSNNDWDNWKNQLFDEE